jgi:hypothetical protein
MSDEKQLWHVDCDPSNIFGKGLHPEPRMLRALRRQLLVYPHRRPPPPEDLQTPASMGTTTAQHPCRLGTHTTTEQESLATHPRSGTRNPAGIGVAVLVRATIVLPDGQSIHKLLEHGATHHLSSSAD